MARWTLAQARSRMRGAATEWALRNPAPSLAVTKKRIRQSGAPRLNALEEAWLHELKYRVVPGVKVRPQDKSYRLANGVNYRPDFSAIVAGRETCWEVKAPRRARWADKGHMTVKVAAAVWPEVRWIFVDRDDGNWRTQEILP